MRKNWKKLVVMGIPVLALAFGVPGAVLAGNLVSNGSFESTTNGPGQLGYNTNATGWTVASGGYTFLYAPGTADNGGSPGQYGNVQLWGPGNGSANGLPASSPAGGNFVAEDGAFQVQPIQQTINGLTVGASYNLSFYFAGAQQYGFTGPTTEGFDVSLGSQTFDTPILSNASHGFTGWQQETFTYTATSTSEVLSFLANGTPSGEPPFTLLDGVSMNAAVSSPEPATLSLLVMGGLAGLGVVRLRRRAKVAATA